jgi:hypothetical protein
VPYSAAPARIVLKLATSFVYFLLNVLTQIFGSFIAYLGTCLPCKKYQPAQFTNHLAADCVLSASAGNWQNIRQARCTARTLLGKTMERRFIAFQGMHVHRLGERGFRLISFVFSEIVTADVSPIACSDQYFISSLYERFYKLKKSIVLPLKTPVGYNYMYFIALLIFGFVLSLLYVCVCVGWGCRLAVDLNNLYCRPTGY